MNVIWKQQHFNNSCASACVAMLLSQYGIDKQDDDVITETMMPYRIQYHPEDGGSFMAGVLLDDEPHNGRVGVDVITAQAEIHGCSRLFPKG